MHTTREVAELLGVDVWRVQRLFEDGTLAEPQRFAGKRVIPSERVPSIVDALRKRGWLPAPEGATS
jgi:predicted site-specific integrase-resolvase